MFDKKQLLTTIMKIIMLVFVAICAGLQTTFLQYVFNGKHRKTYQQAANGITNIMVNLLIIFIPLPKLHFP